MGSEGDVPAFLVGSGVGTPLGTPRSLSNQPYHGTMRFCGGAPTSSLPLLPRPRGARVVAAGRTPQTQTINGGSPSGFSSIRLFLTRTAWNTGQVPLHLPPRYVPLYEYRRAGGHAAPPVDAPCAFLHFFISCRPCQGPPLPGGGSPHTTNLGAVHGNALAGGPPRARGGGWTPRADGRASTAVGFPAARGGEPCHGALSQRCDRWAEGGGGAGSGLRPGGDRPTQLDPNPPASVQGGPTVPRCTAKGHQ